MSSAKFFLLSLLSQYLIAYQGSEGNAKSYQALLSGPRLHFSGAFIADASTVNNDISNYDVRSFLSQHSLRNCEGGKGGYNPPGTNNFMLKDVSIQTVCYANQTCTADRDKDSLLGKRLADSSPASAAKLVDIDPSDLRFTQIWALKINIPQILRADAGVLTMKNIWKRVTQGKNSDRSFSAVFHGILKNVEFFGVESSSHFLRQLQEQLRKSELNVLSIRFVLDMYDHRNLSGRIYGTLGIQGDRGSTSRLFGRVLAPLDTKHHSQAVFSMDEANQMLVFDFGNSFPTNEDGALWREENIVFIIGYFTGNDTEEQTGSNQCVQNYEVLGTVPTKSKHWLENEAGFLSLRISSKQIRLLKQKPLVVLKAKVEVSYNHCSRVIMVERCDGIQILPMNDFVLRHESGEIMDIQFLVSSFGIPKSGIVIDFQFDVPRNNLTLRSCCTPTFQLPLGLRSNENGIASGRIQLPFLNSPRKITDGQLYHISYRTKYACIGKTEEKPKEDASNVLILKIFDHVEYPPLVTWADHVYPIFLQYANLYPVMKGPLFDMSNYYSVVKLKNMIRNSLNLPMNHSSHMPVTRDLSKRKRRMITDWLSQEPPSIGKIEKLINIHRLRSLLQTALEVEHSTIPPYLTALWSIRDGYNRQIHRIIKTIIRQEMLHMALVANLINAVGGHPSLNHSTFIPKYPSRLPGGLESKLIIPLKRLSPKLIKDVFMKIEQPDNNLEHKKFRSAIFDNMKLLHMRNTCKSKAKSRYCEKLHSVRFKGRGVGCPIEVKEHFDMLVGRSKMDISNDINDDSSRRELLNYKDGIASFYTHVLFVLASLTDCGKNDSIFTGNSSFQLTTDSNRYGNGKLIKVTNYMTAVSAIKMIIEEGEGTSECDPAVHYFDAQDDLSHYSMFNTIVMNHRVAIRKRKRKMQQIFSNSTDHECKSTSYDFSGPTVSYVPWATWPIISNAKLADYKQGSLPWIHCHIFARLYNRLLGALHKSFNGEKEHFMNAKFLMYAVDYYGRRLVKLPINEKVNPIVGPTAAPIFKWMRTDISSMNVDRIKKYAGLMTTNQSKKQAEKKREKLKIGRQNLVEKLNRKRAKGDLMKKRKQKYNKRRSKHLQDYYIPENEKRRYRESFYAYEEDDDDEYKIGKDKLSNGLHVEESPQISQYEVDNVEDDDHYY